MCYMHPDILYPHCLFIQVAGRLHIELRKLEGSLNEAYNDDVTSTGSDEELSSGHREITLKVLTTYYLCLE